MRYNYNLSGSDRKPLVEAISQILDKPAVYQARQVCPITVGDFTGRPERRAVIHQ